MPKGFIFIKLFIIAAILGAILGVYFITKRNLYVATSALSPKSTGAVHFEVKGPENDLIPVDISFRTGVSEDEVESISTIAFTLKLSANNNAVVAVTDQDGKVIESVVPAANITSNIDWEFPVNKIEMTNSEIRMDFMAINKNKNGFSSINNENLTTIYVKGLSSKEDLTLEFENHEMLSKRRPITDIWTN